MVVVVNAVVVIAVVFRLRLRLFLLYTTLFSIQVTTASMQAQASGSLPESFLKRLTDAQALFEEELAKGQEMVSSKQAKKAEFKEWFGNYDKAWKAVSKCLDLIAQ